MNEEITISKESHLIAELSLRTMEQLLKGINANKARGVVAEEIVNNCILDKLKTFEVKLHSIKKAKQIGPKGEIVL